MVRKVFRVTERGFYIGTYSTFNKAIKTTTTPKASGWVTTPNANEDRVWETYASTGYEIEELIVR